jgi:uncharacterized protein YdhG (YjbR/CyaY superfamily)
MKKAGRRVSSQTVAAYLAALPKDARAALQRLRKDIKAAAPDATEEFSYGMPTFKHDGPLVYYAAFRDHCSFFPTSVTVMRRFAAELGRYDTSKGTIRFPATEPLPAALVKRIVKARVAENEAGLLHRDRRKRDHSQPAPRQLD